MAIAWPRRFVLRCYTDVCGSDRHKLRGAGALRGPGDGRGRCGQRSAGILPGRWGRPALSPPQVLRGYLAGLRELGAEILLDERGKGLDCPALAPPGPRRRWPPVTERPAPVAPPSAAGYDGASGSAFLARGQREETSHMSAPPKRDPNVLASPVLQSPGLRPPIGALHA
jgi:hypothetical protein